jgi:hypothetical protein
MKANSKDNSLNCYTAESSWPALGMIPSKLYPTFLMFLQISPVIQPGTCKECYFATTIQAIMTSGWRRKIVIPSQIKDLRVLQRGWVFRAVIITHLDVVVLFV